VNAAQNRPTCFQKTLNRWGEGRAPVGKRAVRVGTCERVVCVRSAWVDESVLRPQRSGATCRKKRAAKQKVVLSKSLGQEDPIKKNGMLVKEGVSRW